MKLINGYLRYLRDKKPADGLSVREIPPDYTTNGNDEDLELWSATLSLSPI